jgi:hypothetical protein
LRQTFCHCGRQVIRQHSDERDQHNQPGENFKFRHDISSTLPEKLGCVKGIHPQSTQFIYAPGESEAAFLRQSLNMIFLQFYHNKFMGTPHPSE